MPAMIEYETDSSSATQNDRKGRVIVTTLYSDFSYAQGSLSSEEKTLIHNLITYCKDPTTPATQNLKLAQPIEGITFSIQSPTQLLINGQDATFKIIINNTTGTDRTFRLEENLVHIFSGVIGSYTVPAYTALEIAHIVPNLKGYDENNIWHLFIDAYNENNVLVGNCSIGGMTYDAGCDVKIATENKQYYPNNTVSFNVSLVNSTFGNFFGEINIKVLDSNNNNIFETTENYDFSTSNNILKNYTLSLAANAPEGVYIIVCETKRGIGTTDVVNTASTYFEIPKTKIEIPSELPAVFIPNAINIVRYNITNREGDKTATGTIMVNMIQPDNTLMYTETKNFSILPQQTAPIEFGIPVGNIIFGNYRLEATAYYEGTTAKTINIMPSNATIAVNFNKSYYGIRENLRFDVSVFAGGKFQQKDLKVITEIPALDYTDEKTKTLNPGEVYTSTHMITIPETITAGTYEAKVKLVHPPAGGGDSIEKTFNFTVPPADLKIVNSGIVGLSDSAMYTAGQTANIQIQNTGGVDGKWDYVLRLYNDEELPIYEKQGTTQRLLPLCGIAFSSGPVGPDSESEQEIFFDLSDQLKSGNYRFELNGIETTTGKLAFDYKRLVISGMETRTAKRRVLIRCNFGILRIVGRQIIKIGGISKRTKSLAVA